MGNKTAQEILTARLKQLARKVEIEANRAAESKERYEEIQMLCRQMNDEGVSDGLDKLEERMQERLMQNQEAVTELRRLQARFDEAQELLEILTGEEG